VHLHFRAYGQGEALIILHGLFGSSENWHSICTTLGQDLHDFALDQRNHGRSPHSQQMNYALMARDVYEFIRTQQISRTHLLGHSMGGKTAMQFALEFPEQLAKLIVVDISPRAYAPSHEQIFAALTSLSITQYETRKQIEDALASSLPDLALRRFLLKNLARDAGGRFYWRMGLSEIYKNYDQLCGAIDTEQSFAGPALFIRGETSPYLGPEDYDTITRLFPRAEFRTIPGAGHWVHAKQPTAFVEIVQEFLRT
jgi:pimeloyl-ACP methyl ester carboxylesterase